MIEKALTMHANTVRVWFPACFT